ncbi:MAG: hypothetical protein E4G98_02925 [Promethearchaeota archaeon]|nr:MAG: hypothetical protein E4G98_02925 [Candidatus Lokiarchaeota archaeon]
MITNGIVTFSIGQVAGFVGTFDHISDGLYRLSIATTSFPSVGSYTLNILAQKLEYESQSLTLYLNIIAIRTEINNTLFLQDSAEIYVGTEHYYDFNYTIQETDALIIGANIAYIECEYQIDGVLHYFTQDLEDLGNGLYRLDLNTLQRPIARYTIAIYIGKDNYITRSSSLVLDILPRNIGITFGSQFQARIVEGAEGDLITIDFDLTDSITGLPLAGATIVMNYRGEEWNITEITDGYYKLTIDTSLIEYSALFAAVTEEATISIQKTNYTIADQTITISITPPEFTVGQFGVPRIFVYIGGAVALLAIAIAGTTRYIRYARIPLIVKQIESTRKLIAGNKTISDENLTSTYEEEMIELYHDAWDMLDLDLTKIIGTTSSSSGNLLGDESQGGI